MSSFIWPKGGMFDPTKQFAFTNITDHEFVSAWDSKKITVPAGQTVKLPHHLAVKLTTELVDKIMMDEVNADVAAHIQTNPYYRSNKGASMAVPAARKPYEDKILVELPSDNSPQFEILKAQAREEILNDLKAQPSSPITSLKVSEEEFAEIKPKAKIK